jgi:dTDP-4-amino-4,6-dideoxygalactose transaminase
MTAPAARSQAIEVPFLDLAPSHSELKDALLADVADLIESGAFTNGPAVATFERDFAAYCRAHHCVGTASGLDALRLALVAGGIGPGDEVVIPALTFVATAESVTQAGGAPVLVDVRDDDYTLDVAQLATIVTSRTRFCIPVHLYGQLADMRSIAAASEPLGVAIIEDACQAHGAERDGLRAGELSQSAAYSFYPGKNLGAMGDAGALTTNDGSLAHALRALREHGQFEKYRHAFPGWTSRLDTIQALVLTRKLELLDGWIGERRAAADYYLDALTGVGDLVLPAVAPRSAPVWHLFVVRTDSPDALGTFLRGRSIATARHYPEPVHLTQAYASLGYRRGDFPVAERVARECLSLPIFPGIREEQLAAVVAGVKEYFGG